MIVLTKLNDVAFLLNCDMIETITENPDTTITLSNGRFYIVKESIKEVQRKTIAYKRGIYLGERQTREDDIPSTT